MLGRTTTRKIVYVTATADVSTYDDLYWSWSKEHWARATGHRYRPKKGGGFPFSNPKSPPFELKKGDTLELIEGQHAGRRPLGWDYDKSNTVIRVYR